MRTGTQAKQFFKKGRVFATLYTEPTGRTAHHDPGNEAYTTVRFGASVYTQIRRFVVVSVRTNFVYAWSVFRPQKGARTILTVVARLQRTGDKVPESTAVGRANTQ